MPTCAPGASVGSGATSGNGLFIRPSPHGGYEILLGTSASSGGPALASASYSCGFHYEQAWDVGDSDFLGSDFCWNGSTADAYNLHATCQPTLPGDSCQYQRTGVTCNYCSPNVFAWGQYYQGCSWVFTCNDELVIVVNRNGSWYGYSYGI